MSKFGFFGSLDEQRAYMRPRLQRWYQRFQSGGMIFRNEIERVITPVTILLDAGAGASGIIGEFRGRVGRIIGVDTDEEAGRNNTSIDKFFAGDLETIPMDDASVDVVTSEFVLEHLERPDRVFQEIHRVLMPGGTFVALTSNVLNPIMTISKLTPHSFHDLLRTTLLHKSEHADRTYYRANTIGKIQQLAHQAGLETVRISRAGNPEYLSFWKPLVIPAIMLEQLAAAPWLRFTQMYLVSVIRKPA